MKINKIQHFSNVEIGLLNNIGQKIKELRIERSMTQERLAHLCNTDASYIRKVESVKVNISVKRLERIVSQLSSTLSEFFEGIA